MPPAKAWYYFNGFNSAIPDDYSGNAKIEAVAECARQNGYCFLPVSICYRQAPAQVEQIVEGLQRFRGEVILSGSSMGGWLARISQLHLDRLRPELPAVVVALNPAYDLARHGHLLEGPQINFVTGERYVWTPEHSASLAGLERAVDYDSPLPFFVYVDQGDEVIDWRGSARRHRAIAEFVAYEGGSHSFDHCREAMADFAAHLRK